MIEIFGLFQQLITSSDLAQLGVILLVMLLVTSVMIKLKQPLIIGYLVSGIVVGPLVLGLVSHSPDGHSFLELFSELGIALLLFMVGVGLNPDLIREHGKVSLGIGGIQIILTLLIGWGVSAILGYDMMTSLFVGLALTFSSTIVLVKLLTDKHEEESTYGKLSLGVLIVQDIVVMLLLMVVAFFGGSGAGGSVMIVEGVLLIVGTVAFARYVLPQLMYWIAQYEDLLLLTGIGWCLILGTLFQIVGFSFEIGCLLAGMSFSSSPFRLYITAKLRSLRDFFIVLFFISLGLELEWSGLLDHRGLLLGGLLVVVVCKPLIIYLASTRYGYTHQVSTKAALSLGQISEFGFIVLGIGLSAGFVSDPGLMSVMVMIGLVTIGLSSYVTVNNDAIYARIQRLLGKDSVASTEELLTEALCHVEVILFGYGRVGKPLSDFFDHEKISHVVIDHNPALIDHLEARDGEYIYADAMSVDVYERLFHSELKMVVTTIGDLEDDLFIIEQVKQYDPTVLVVTVSNQREYALQLYAAGADYVIMPDALSAQHVAQMMREKKFDRDFFDQQKEDHLTALSVWSSGLRSSYPGLG